MPELSYNCQLFTKCLSYFRQLTPPKQPLSIQLLELKLTGRITEWVKQKGVQIWLWRHTQNR